MPDKSDIRSAPLETPDLEQFAPSELGADELVRGTFDAIEDGIVVVRLPERTIELCNPAAADMFATSRDELIGASPDVLHVDEEAARRFREKMLDGLREEGVFRGRHRMQRADGRTFPTEHLVSFVGEEGEGPKYAVNLVRDITDRVDHERNLHLLDELNRALTDADDFDQALAEALGRFGRHVGAQFAEAWTLEDPGGEGRLVLRSTWSGRSEGASDQVGADDVGTRAGTDETLEIGEGLPGRAWSLGEPVTLDEPAETQSRAAEGLSIDPRAALAAPVLREGTPVAVLTWYTDCPAREATTVEALARSVTSKLGTFLRQQEIERELREERDRFEAVASNVAETLWMTDPEKTEMQFVNDAYERIWGRSKASLKEDPESWLEAVHPEDRARVQAAAEEQVEGNYDETFRIVRPDGEIRWVHDRAYPIRRDGEVVRIVGVAQDITKRRRYERELEHQTLHDTLTGLPNRRLFRDRVEHALKRNEEDDDAVVAVALFDVARLRVVNKSLGHSGGDALLETIAGRLTDLADETATVARFGSDEFAVLFDSVDDVDEVKDRIDGWLVPLTEPCEIEGTTVHPKIDVGISCVEDGSDVESLLRNGHAAIGEAKSEEGSTVRLRRPDRRSGSVDLLSRENRLHQAVERREFAVHYQPVVDLRPEGEAEIGGVEALVRWEHPEEGLVSPGEFIPLAEETGLIVPIGYQVLEETCRTAAEWCERYPDTSSAHELSVSVNLSVRQYREPDLVDRIREIAVSTGFPLERLILEITESILVTGESKLEALREEGARISIDDFGTGYSSLQYLRRLEADELKIDHSFVQHLDESDRDRALVDSILGIGEKCDLDVVVEGVETERQLELIRNLGADIVQGYYFGRPMPAEDFESRYYQHE